MDMTARKTELEQTIQHATAQIGNWTQKLIRAQAQLDLLIELTANGADVKDDLERRELREQMETNMAAIRSRAGSY